MIQANAFLCVGQDISVGKASIVQSPGENSPVPQVQERQIPSEAKTQQLIRGMEGLQKKMTRRSKTKSERATITFKKDIKGEGQRRRALEVQGKRWSRTENNVGCLSKRMISP